MDISWQNELDQLASLQNAMLTTFGEDFVYDVADRVEFMVDVVPDMLDDESVLEMFAGIVGFIVEELAPINKEKARTVLKAADIPDKDIDDLLDF